MGLATNAADLLSKLLPRKMAWRLGRAIYIRARGEHPNTQIHDQEHFLQRWALSHLGRGELFAAVDAGANVGNWTCDLHAEAERQAREIRVHAFEPAPSTFALLKKRLEPPSRPPLAEAYNQALGSVSGHLKLFLDGDTAGTNSLHASSALGIQPFIDVQVLTFDDHLQTWGIPKVHLLKIDTEGHDFEVLHGASQALKDGRIDLIQFEYNHRWVFSRHYLRDVFLLAEATGYMVGRCNRGELLFIDSWNPELERFFECNLILMRKDLIAMHQCHVGGFDRYQVYD